MDGRRFLRWCLSGGLLVGAVGCNRNSYHDKFGMPRPGETASAIAGTGNKPSLWNWGRTPSGPPGPGQAVPGHPGSVPNEVAAAGLRREVPHIATQIRHADGVDHEFLPHGARPDALERRAEIDGLRCRPGELAEGKV